METFKNGDVVKLKASVKNHTCAEGREDNQTAVVFTTYGNKGLEVMLREDLHGCRFWNASDLELAQ